MVDDNRESDNNLTTTERVSVQTDTRTGGEELSPSSPPQTQDRNALLDCARTFLKSPDVVHEDPTTKRRFLTDKGLREDEIDGLMPSSTPTCTSASLSSASSVEFTTSPTWIDEDTLMANRRLRRPHFHLLPELKASQAETHAVLPAPSASYEPKQFAEFHKLEKLGIERDTPIEVPEFTLLRCTIEGLLAEGKKATKEELFALLEERFSWLKTDEGLTYQNSLWEKLTTYPCFSESDENNRLVWTYTAPTPPDPTPLLTSLTSLKSSFPPARTEPSAIQRALDTLADFTGYITTQTYQLAAGSMRLHAGHGYSTFGAPSQLTPQQEEVKKDIRALKGLVLNRRTFAPTATRATSYTPASVTP
ncbi:hypothetical protein A7U60_g8558 [Sanghuangporus baumii]|uniref:Peroxisome membrane anchor protein Pex14p N-terminal domain-containing protein n=1 Tax=Sanghuangporus baumii TaxID=108892 RepID=A0A9Q5MYK2_SANBA|nr:hypothetical protein A7U60_g8558 [Sanghuangporus baumii]